MAQLLGNALGVILPSTIMFDYPSIEALAAAIAGPAEVLEDNPTRSGSQDGSAPIMQRRKSSFSDLFRDRNRSLSDVFKFRCIQHVELAARPAPSSIAHAHC